MKLIDESDLILLVLDTSSELAEEDKKLIDLTKDKKRIIIFNKIDLDSKINIDLPDTIYMSTKNKEGLDSLKKKIVEMFNLDEIKPDMNIFVNANDIAKIKKCLNLLEKIKESIVTNIEIDMIEIDLREINDLLGSIIGESYEEEILDEIFKNFCIGK